MASLLCSFPLLSLQLLHKPSNAHESLHSLAPPATAAPCPCISRLQAIRGSSFTRLHMVRRGIKFRRLIVRMSPDPEKVTKRNPLDFPFEWERPRPGRRPDIFPQFSPMKTPLPPPMPADPPFEVDPDEEEEEEEKKEEEEEQPPDEEQPEQPEE